MSKGLCNGSSSRLGSPEDVVDHQSGIDFCNWIKYSEKKQTLQCTTAPITLYYPKKLHYLSSGHIWTGQRIGLITWVSNFWIHKKFHSWVTSPDWGLFELSEYPYTWSFGLGNRFPPARRPVNLGLASLMGQWIRIHLPRKGSPVWSLAQEDPTCCRTTKPSALQNPGVPTPEAARCKYWSLFRTREATQWETCAPQGRVAPRSPHWTKSRQRNVRPAQPETKLLTSEEQSCGHTIQGVNSQATLNIPPNIKFLIY